LVECILNIALFLSPSECRPFQNAFDPQRRLTHSESATLYQASKDAALSSLLFISILNQSPQSLTTNHCPLQFPLSTGKARPMEPESVHFL